MITSITVAQKWFKVYEQRLQCRSSSKRKSYHVPLSYRIIRALNTENSHLTPKLPKRQPPLSLNQAFNSLCRHVVQTICICPPLPSRGKICPSSKPP